jgi:DNA-binding NtrC family response regulator
MNSSRYPGFGLLLVDDEPAWLRSLALTLERSAGVTNILTCNDSRQVMELLETRDIGIVLLDMNMPHLAGDELLAGITERFPELIVIVISGMNQVENAVRCMKLGAFDYFVKTVEEDRLLGGVLRAIRMRELQQENREISSQLLRGGLRRPEAFGSIVTGDRTMLTIFAYVEAVAGRVVWEKNSSPARPIL